MNNLVKEPMQVIGTRLVREMRDADRPELHCPADVECFLREHLDMDADREVCGVICMSPSGQVNHAEILSVGTVSATPADPRAIIRAAVLSASAIVCLFHTHPTSSLRGPSIEDVTMTYRMQKVSELMGLSLIDHIILSHDDHFSFAVAADIAGCDDIEEFCVKFLEEDKESDSK